MTNRINEYQLSKIERLKRGTYSFSVGKTLGGYFRTWTSKRVLPKHGKGWNLLKISYGKAPGVRTRYWVCFDLSNGSQETDCYLWLFRALKDAWEAKDRHDKNSELTLLSDPVPVLSINWISPKQPKRK